MSVGKSSGSIDFADEVLRRIAAALASEARPERAALLPELLRAWAAADLQDHLMREGRVEVKQRQQRLEKIGEKARNLLDAIAEMDEQDRIEIATKAQTRLQIRDGSLGPGWAALGVPSDLEGGNRRQSEALSWLRDLADALAAPPLEPPPDKRTLGYLVVLDLAAICQIITGASPTRRNNSYADNGQQALARFGSFVLGSST